MGATLTLYLARQGLAPFAAATLVLGCIVWLTQSLQMVGLLVNRGQSLVDFLRLTALAWPALLAVVLPFAFALGVLFGVYRLASESELITALAAGGGRGAFARALLVMSVAGAAATLALNLWAMPAGYRQLKSEIYQIRANLAASLVRPGEFTTPIDGLTLYARRLDRGEEMTDLLLHDTRDPAGNTTYIARTASLRDDNGRLLLFMKDGSIQRRMPDGVVNLLAFEDYAFDISRFAEAPEARAREATERYIHELLRPDPASPYDVAHRETLIAAGHARLAGVLYYPATAMIALAAGMFAPGGRRGLAWTFLGALAAALGVRLVGLLIEAQSVSNAILVPATYAWPAIAGLAAWRVATPRTARNVAPQ